MNRRLQAAWAPPPLGRAEASGSRPSSGSAVRTDRPLGTGGQVRHRVRDLRRIVPRAPASSIAAEPLPGPLILDLVAAVLAGGASPPGALRDVGAALTRAGDPSGRRLDVLSAELMHPPTATPADAGGDWVAVLGDELALAMRSGLPPSALLRRAAEEQRRRSSAAQRRAVQRLEVLLVVPTALCLLPAFVLLGVVPVILALFLQ